MTADDLAQLVARFQSAAVPAAEWTHAAHLRVAAWHVHHLGRAAALDRLRAGIRRLNEQHGTGNSPTRGYHETITVAYVHLIAELFATFPAALPFADRVERLLAGPLADRAVLLTFWSRDALMSPAARRAFVDPDVAPLALPPDAAGRGAGGDPLP